MQGPPVAISSCGLLALDTLGKHRIKVVATGEGRTMYQSGRIPFENVHKLARYACYVAH
jgi:hypothetical protein